MTTMDKPTSDTAALDTSSLDDVRLARIALSLLAEPGSRALHRLIAAAGPVDALDALLYGKAEPELADAAASRLASGDPRHAAERAHAHAVRAGARLITPEDDQWPVQLADLRLISRDGAGHMERDTYPPVVLWVRGDWPVADLMAKSVAIVGSRAATTYGTHLATELGHGLASHGWAVVSGGAYGIDAAAHRGALASGGVTAAVLACGADRAYPPGNTGLLDHIGEDGLVISEWPPGAQPHRHRLLVRNRVIAALSRGTVLVEANARSSARQTLDRAAQLQRRCMAVPGPVTSPLSVGCHQAIRAGTRLVTNSAEVLEEVERIGDDLAPSVRGPETPRDRLGAELSRILDAVPHRAAADPARIAATAGVSLREALRALPVLQSAGFVTQHNDGWTTARPTNGTPGHE